MCSGLKHVQWVQACAVGSSMYSGFGRKDSACDEADQHQIIQIEHIISNVDAKQATLLCSGSVYTTINKLNWKTHPHIRPLKLSLPKWIILGSGHSLLAESLLFQTLLQRKITSQVQVAMHV